jgi:hypothetical protein
MRKFFSHTMAIGAALALFFVANALAAPHTIRAGNLFLRDNGGIFPSKIPRHSQVPISGRIEAEIGTVDGSHPPAVTTANIDFDKSIQVHADGLPICRPSQLIARSTVAAKKACPAAIVGSGTGEVEVAFPEQAPFTASGPILLFNGGVQGGTTRLFVHTYVGVPAPTAVTVPVTLTQIHRGHYGIHAVAQIPKIAGGSGSVIGFKLTLGRRFTYKGKQESYATASCPTGHYYTEGHILFADGSSLQGTHILPCTPIDD